LASTVAGCSTETPPQTPRLIDVPAAVGSMGPNLASGPDGNLVLSWIEPDGDGHALRYAVFGNAGWGAPRTVARGDSWFVNWADFPSVVPLSDTLWGAHWLDSQPDGGYAYDINVSMSRDAGSTWSEPFLPHFDGTATEHGFVTLFPDSNGMGMVWLDGRKMVNEYDENDVRASGMTLRAATFGEDKTPIRSALVDDLTCDCCQTDVALTADGPVVVYRDRTTNEVRDIYVSRREFNEWQPGTAVANDNWNIAACPVNGPIIRADGDRVAVAWFTAAGGSPMVKAAWSNNSGQTFSDPVEISADIPVGHLGAALLLNGDLVVAWQRKIGAGGAELLLRRVSVDGELSAVRGLQESADIFSFSVPQVAVTDAGIVTVWTTEINGDYGVRSAILPLSWFE
jgi:hypothetical protein